MGPSPITWQYDDYVGTKADVGARILLAPASKKISDADAGIIYHVFSVAGSHKRYGLQQGDADGDGHIYIDSLPAGRYNALILSGTTLRDSQAPLEPYELTQLQAFFVDEAGVAIATTKPAILLVFKWTTQEITIRPGSLTHCSYDFGHTYY